MPQADFEDVCSGPDSAGRENLLHRRCERVGAEGLYFAYGKAVHGRVEIVDGLDLFDGRFEGAAGDSPGDSRFTPSLTDTSRGTAGPAGMTRTSHRGTAAAVPFDTDRYQAVRTPSRRKTLNWESPFTGGPT